MATIMFHADSVSFDAMDGSCKGTFRVEATEGKAELTLFLTEDQAMDLVDLALEILPQAIIDTLGKVPAEPPTAHSDATARETDGEGVNRG
jgi:hypothetical protein